VHFQINFGVLGQMSERFKIGTKYHCREELSGDNLTGFCIINNSSIEATLFSYEKFFNIDCEKYIPIRIENNIVVSMHNNITNFGRWSSMESCVYSFSINSSLAIVGATPWQSDNLLKHVFFRIEHVNASLQHFEKLKAAAISAPFSGDNRKLFSISVADIRISAYYVASYSMLLHVSTDMVPSFEIEFQNGRSINNYRRELQSIVRFFAAL